MTALPPNQTLVVFVMNQSVSEARTVKREAAGWVHSSASQGLLRLQQLLP